MFVLVSKVENCDEYFQPSIDENNESVQGVASVQSPTAGAVFSHWCREKDPVSTDSAATAM